MENTFFGNWQNGISGYTNLGDFETKLMQAYSAADGTNKQKLEIAFPVYFTIINPQNVEINTVRMKKGYSYLLTDRKFITFENDKDIPYYFFDEEKNEIFDVTPDMPELISTQKFILASNDDKLGNVSFLELPTNFPVIAENSEIKCEYLKGVDFYKIRQLSY